MRAALRRCRSATLAQQLAKSFQISTAYIASAEITLHTNNWAVLVCTSHF
ncbi:hypothetical protein Pint_20724 [Pistacia integerrima]|uniref:Uncharacterized protein n=1 Tax=Pistacia integerrima TaxID=434235 RepID=A0ACC0X7P3_9ROSI|nr:hypothetical protein Pint_20724 [Pistacia integerrima]